MNRRMIQWLSCDPPPVDLQERTLIKLISCPPSPSFFDFKIIPLPLNRITLFQDLKILSLVSCLSFVFNFTQVSKVGFQGNPCKGFQFLLWPSYVFKLFSGSQFLLGF